MILLLSANWPQRALLRAQLCEDTGREVVGAQSAEDALRWLATTRFDLLVLDTQGLPPDERLLGSIRAHRLPLVVVTGPSDRARWSPALAGLDVRAVRLRPVFIGDVTRAARAALRADD